MEEDHETGSVSDILQQAARCRHQILYLNYKCLAELPPELYALWIGENGEGRCVYDCVERLYLKRNLLSCLVRFQSHSFYNPNSTSSALPSKNAVSAYQMKYNLLPFTLEEICRN